MAWATPKYGSDNKSFPASLKDGDNIFRILPPLHSQEATGKWAISHTQHFGYATKNGDKTNYNPFYCVEKGKFVQGELVILQACPECVLLKSKQDEFDVTKKTLKAQGKSEKEVANATEALSNFVRNHNRDFKWYINVKHADGTYGTIKVPGKVKKAIDGLIAEFQKRKVPLDAIAAEQGLYFVVNKSGKGIGTEYTTKVLMEEVTRDGETFERPKLCPLTEKDYADACEKCRDIVDVGIRSLEVGKVQMLVESGGDPDVIEAVFKSSEKNETPPPSTPPKTEAKPETPTPPKTEAKPETPTPPKTEAKPETPKAPPVDAAVAEAEAKLAALRKQLADAEAAAKAATAPKSDPAKDPAAKATGAADQDFDSFAAGFATEG